VTVSTEQQYKDALQNLDAHKIFINQNITLNPQSTDTYRAVARNNGSGGSLGFFSLEGNWDGSAPLFALIGSGSHAGAAFSVILGDGSITANIDTIKNLAVRDFARHFPGNEDSDGIFDLGHVTGGIHNVHFENNNTNYGVSALLAESVSGGINGSRFINNRSLTHAALEVETLNGGLNDTVFIGNRVQLPGDFPNFPRPIVSAVSSAALLHADVQLANTVFLGNTSSLINAQNPTLGDRGAALVHTTDPASGTSSMTISASALRQYPQRG